MAHRQTDRFSRILLLDAGKRISFSVLETLKFAFLVKKANLSRNLISLRKENWDICLATTPLQQDNRKKTLQSLGLWSTATMQNKNVFLFQISFVSWSCNSDINGSKASMTAWRLEGANWQIAGILLPSIMFWRRLWCCWCLIAADDDNARYDEDAREPVDHDYSDDDDDHFFSSSPLIMMQWWWG